jgi:mono/diheme cytochrome c family protein
LFNTLAGVAAISVVVVSLAFADTGKKPAAKKLTGQELYAINCSRCHSERYATERTPAQWKTLMLHMRTRAQIPAAQAKEILKYLQEDAGK